MQDLLSQSYFGNPARAYLWAVGYFTVGVLLLSVLRPAVFGRLRRAAEKSATHLDDFFVANLEKTLTPLLFFGLFYLSLQNLVLSAAAQKIISTLGVIFLTFMAVRFLSALLGFLLQEVLLKKETVANRERNLKLLFPVIRLALWSVALVFLLDNMGFQISAVVAGLGIGGIAVAMASQAVLGDLFSYVAILLDKPFELGDYVVLDGGFMGTIENIGVKTTRLRSLSGEQLVISNSDLTGSRVRNYKRMQERRVVFKLGVTYDTNSDKLEKAVAIVKEEITKRSAVRFDRAHFSEFGDSNLIIEAVYWVLSPEYNHYMDVHQELNFAVKRAFEKEGIRFAFPTQTLYVKKEG